MPSAQVVLTLANQTAPQLRQTADEAKQLAAAEARAQQAALTRAQAVARLQIALGNNAAAEQTLSKALAGVTAETTGTIRVQTQLVAIQQRSASAASAEAAAQRQAMDAMRASVSPATAVANATKNVGASTLSANSYVDAFKSGLLNIVGPAAAVSASLAILKGAVDLTVAGENTNRVERSFQSLATQAGTTGDAMLVALRKASGNEISDLNLELAVNKGLLLGVANNAQQFGGLMEVARDRAAKFGITTTEAFDKITLGVGRESPRILDDLGFIVDADKANTAYAASVGKSVDQLTKAERIEALRNAVIKQGLGTLDAATTAINDQTNAYARLAIAAENAKNKIGSQLSTATQGPAGFTADVVSASASDNNQDRALGLVLAFAKAMGYQVSATTAATTATAASIPVAQTAAQLAQQSTTAQLGYANALEMSGVQARALALANQQKADSDKLASIDAQTHALAEKQIDDAARAAADAMIANGRAGQIAAIQLATSSNLLDQRTAAYYRLEAATIAANNAENAKSVAKTVATNRFTGRSSGREGGSDFAAETAASVAATRAQTAATEKTLDAQIALAAAKGQTGKQIDLLRQKEQLFGKDSADRMSIEAQIISLQTKGGTARSSALTKELGLHESIYDSINKQKDALLDIEELAIKDRQTDRDDAQKIKTANAIIAATAGRTDANAVDLRGRAQDALALISVQDRQRAQQLAEKGATAGGTIGPDGKLRQSVPSGLPPPPGGATSGAVGLPPVSGGGASQGSTAPLNATINLVVDGKVLAAVSEPYIMDALIKAVRGAKAQEGA